MKPRTAGIAGMVVALAATVLGGFLIANPLLSLVGAVLLVAASILFALAATWAVFRSWGPSGWRESTGPTPGVLRFWRWVCIVELALLPLLVGYSVWSLLTSGEGWFNIIQGVFLFALAVSQYRIFRARESRSHRAGAGS